MRFKSRITSNKMAVAIAHQKRRICAVGVKAGVWRYLDVGVRVRLPPTHPPHAGALVSRGMRFTRALKDQTAM